MTKLNTMPTNTSLVWLMLGLSLAAAPHFAYQPFWVSLLFLSMIAWRGFAIWRHWPLPGKHRRYLSLIKWFIAASAIGLMFKSYGNFIGRDAGTALLIVMLGLKIIEIRNHRDYYISCFLGYFLVAINFLYSQSIATALLMLIVIILMTTCLVSLNDIKQTISKTTQFKLASKMLLQAIPLMILLFVFFPRITGPLWGMPQDAQTAQTGINNKMTLGNLSQLIQSDAVAFRVKFNQAIPSNNELYWRGPVLWETDGRTWRELTLPYRYAKRPPTITTMGKSVRYTVTLEPHNKNWLFALDVPTELPTTLSALFSHDGKLLSAKPIKQRIQYQLNSKTHFAMNPDTEPLLADALKLPAGYHPRTRALAEQWRQESSQPEDIIEMALNHFNQQPFYYTLTPPPLNGDTIDGFLFESGKGFCEHYAASFTVLMRAAGIPTRLVTGYQGGAVNPVDGYLVVRQRDAHAWTEVWLSGRGWVRIDPTGAVSHDRIELGMADILPSEMRAPLFFAQSDSLIDVWQQVSNNWDAVNNAWNRSILAYGPELQKSFLSQLGMTNPNWQSMAFTLFAAFSVMLLFTSAILLYSRRDIDPVAATYQKFCDRFAKLGLTARYPYEGPLDFASRMVNIHPGHKADIDLITTQYISLRYGQTMSSLDEFKHTVKRFKPKIA
jgi:transglutaminase-like putative cysteine protease